MKGTDKGKLAPRPLATLYRMHNSVPDLVELPEVGQKLTLVGAHLLGERVLEQPPLIVANAPQMDEVHITPGVQPRRIPLPGFGTPDPHVYRNPPQPTSCPLPRRTR